jgi:hypothetical protein
MASVLISRMVTVVVGGSAKAVRAMPNLAAASTTFCFVPSVGIGFLPTSQEE